MIPVSSPLPGMQACAGLLTLIPRPDGDGDPGLGEQSPIVETGTDSWRFKKTLERQRRKGVGSQKTR